MSEEQAVYGKPVGQHVARRMGRVQVSQSSLTNEVARSMLALAFAALDFVVMDVQRPMPFVADVMELVGVSSFFEPVRSGSVVPLYDVTIHQDGPGADNITVDLRRDGVLVASVTVSIFRYVHVWKKYGGDE